MRRISSTTKIFISAVIALIAITGSFFLAAYVRDSSVAQALVSQFGYIGVLMLAVVAGLNAFIPIPAATFTAVFTAAGLQLPIIVLMLVLGTLIADFTGYIFGRWGRELVTKKYPKTYRMITTITVTHRRWLPLFITGYAAFIPLPNETIVIPLAISGIRFETMLIPLLIGNAINQTALAYGIHNIFSWLF
jgi:membrane protein YqaA with SNARE-associated domain